MTQFEKGSVIQPVSVWTTLVDQVNWEAGKARGPEPRRGKTRLETIHQGPM